MIFRIAHVELCSHTYLEHNSKYYTNGIANTIKIELTTSGDQNNYNNYYTSDPQLHG